MCSFLLLIFIQPNQNNYCESGCCWGWALINASSVSNSSTIRVIIGNWSRSTLNLELNQIRWLIHLCFLYLLSLIFNFTKIFLYQYLLALYTCGTRQQSAIVMEFPTQYLPEVCSSIFSTAENMKTVKCFIATFNELIPWYD